MSASLHITPESRLWPAELAEIEQAPEALWIRGRSEILARRPRVAVVGTRAPTPYGELQAARLAAFLAFHGVTVVSGLARGIDATAHLSALENRGATLAVLGSGVDNPWPAGELATRMVAEGLLLSEHPPGQAPRRHHFPFRNRLIAALSSAVVVVEAAHSSGSLITARWAADQGRAVFAVPGRIDHPMARGCHRLIREGAELLESPEDLIPVLGLAPRLARPEKPSEHPFLTALRGETLTADELATRLALSPEEVLVGLVELELAGAVVRGPGGLYRERS
jgi:DNA processing protein